MRNYILTAGLALGTYMGRHLHKTPSISRLSSTPTTSSCKHPVVRREWRSLSNKEKHEYLDAVLCLKDIPSRIGENQSLYDDFPRVHYRIGDYCKFLPNSSDSENTRWRTNKFLAHHAAAFLAWHRSFIHTYERALREDCGYQGHLV